MLFYGDAVIVCQYGMQEVVEYKYVHEPGDDDGTGLKSSLLVPQTQQEEPTPVIMALATREERPLKHDARRPQNMSVH
jgi:hypothetical protein